MSGSFGGLNITGQVVAIDDTTDPDIVTLGHFSRVQPGKGDGFDSKSYCYVLLPSVGIYWSGEMVYPGGIELKRHGLSCRWLN